MPALHLLATCQLSDRLQRINLVDCLIRPQTYDARKAQSVPTFVPVRWLHAVESYLDDDAGLDSADTAMREFLQGMRAKPLGQFSDFYVG